MTDESPNTFRKRFIEVSDQDINLKFLFDHMRNYLICGAVMFAGAKIMFGKDSFSGIPYSGLVAGLILVGIGYGLFWMNIFQGMFAASVYGKLKPQKSLSVFAAFVIFGTLLTLVFLELIRAKFG